MLENLENIIESLLFVSEEPLTVEKFKNILETVDPKEIRSTLHSLAQRYDQRGGGFKLSEVAGGWQLRSRPEYNRWIKRMLQPSPQRLSKAALETLAIVAYNQPIIRADIEHIRGVDAGGVLRQLLERKLIRVLGRKEIPGRPLIYATTKLFLELFELKDLKDLPSPKEIEEISTATADFADDAVPVFEQGDSPETEDLRDSNQEFRHQTAAAFFPGQNIPIHHIRKPVGRADAHAHAAKAESHLYNAVIASTPSKLPSDRSPIPSKVPRISATSSDIRRRS